MKSLGLVPLPLNHTGRWIVDHGGWTLVSARAHRLQLLDEPTTIENAVGNARYEGACWLRCRQDTRLYARFGSVSDLKVGAIGQDTHHMAVGIHAFA